jgi:hypothetical protein
MTEADIQRIVSGAVAGTLIKLGIDADDPVEFQKDMAHLREWRQSVETVKRQTIVTAVGIFTAGVLGLIWMAFRSAGNG